jgi:pentachlorophenol monooxygenase
MESSIDVLVVGAGPVGLTAACELRRHGAACRIVDRLDTPPLYAKAVGIQPRTLEIWEDLGILDAALDAAVELRGMLVFVNGREAMDVKLELPPEIPYRFVGLPQYETERILREQLERLGGTVERSVELRSFAADGDGVVAELDGPRGAETVRTQYLVGSDGAHSVVRKGLGLSFEGAAFPEEYMLGDVEVDWSLPPGVAIRALHQADGETDDLLVCIPLPGHGRYRMSMLVPPELAAAPATESEHGLITDRPGPSLDQIQAVLDRLAPEPTTASNLRWSSIFRISHRLVDRYGEGRVFVVGDAAHIHPPTGAQGMNTGIQDAYNLAWKLALAARGEAAEGLLESYHAERHPVGEEVVGRTVRHARAQPDAEDGVASEVLREAQLLVAYPDSPLVAEAVDGAPFAGGPAPGDRAPDCRGLTRSAVAFGVRLFELLRGTDHTLLLYADATAGRDELRGFEGIAAAARERCRGRLRTYAVLAPDVDRVGVALPVVGDAEGTFRAAYGVSGAGVYLVRPDGYVGYRAKPPDADRLVAHLARTFA